MMSIERELLMRWWRGATDQADLNELYDTTVKLLTQPEQEPICKGIEKNKFNEGLKVGQEAGYRAILEAAKAKQFYLDENERLSNLLLSAEDKIQELLAQPEQEPEPLLAETKIEWYGKGFRQGVNEFAPPKPLTEDVIYALDKEGVVENMDDHQVRYVIRWIRRVEKAHGIGGGNE